jgi:hypothetical protein
MPPSKRYKINTSRWSSIIETSRPKIGYLTKSKTASHYNTKSSNNKKLFLFECTPKLIYKCFPFWPSLQKLIFRNTTSRLYISANSWSPWVEIRKQDILKLMFPYLPTDSAIFLQLAMIGWKLPDLSSYIQKAMIKTKKFRNSMIYTSRKHKTQNL